MPNKRWSRGRWLVAALVFLPGLALIVGALVFRDRLPPATTVPGHLRTLRLTGSGPDRITPALSEDGSLVAYSSNATGPFEIHTRPAQANAKDRQVTRDGGDNIQPAWSPDGRAIAYQSVENRGIFVVGAEGGPPRRLTESGVRPAWSPDGQWIAFSSPGPDAGGTQIWLVPAAGGPSKPLTQPGQPPGSHEAPAWSPDGKRLLFASAQESTTLWNISVSGGEAQRVALEAGPYRTPQYSADGRGMFYVVQPEKAPGSVFLFRPPPDEIGPIQVLKMPAAGPIDISVSHDGRRLAYILEDILFVVELR